jgi:hypothetical protein
MQTGIYLPLFGKVLPLSADVVIKGQNGKTHLTNFSRTYPTKGTLR